MNEPVQIKTSKDSTVWEILSYSVHVFFKYMQYWFLFNISYIGYSLAILTIPAAKIALTKAIWIGLENADGIKNEDTRKMREYLKQNFSKSLYVFIVKMISFGIIGFSIWFWISRPETIFHFISILSIYGLVLAWMTNFYLYPVLVEDQDRSINEALKIAFKKAFTNPFESLLFSFLDFVLWILEVILFGPLMVVLPSLRKILAIVAYWYVSEKEIPIVVREFKGFKFLKPKE